MKKTWDMAAERWHRMGLDRAAETIRREAQLLRWLYPHLANVDLATIRGGRILELRDLYHTEGQSPRSCNYLVGLIRSVLKAAYEWEWLTMPPPAVRKLREPPPRDRWLTVAQADHLLSLLPPTVADMASMALETGLRRANVCGLRWEWVNLDHARIDIPATAMKARRPHAVALTGRAVEVLRRHQALRTPLCGYVFHNRGNPIWQPNGRTWLRAVAAAGLGDFRWHDLRHTWASWQAQAGTEVQVLRSMGAWQTMSMVGRYSHLPLEPARAAAARLEVWRS